MFEVDLHFTGCTYLVSSQNVYLLVRELFFDIGNNLHRNAHTVKFVAVGNLGQRCEDVEGLTSSFWFIFSDATWRNMFWYRFYSNSRMIFRQYCRLNNDELYFALEIIKKNLLLHFLTDVKNQNDRTDKIYFLLNS